MTLHFIVYWIISGMYTAELLVHFSLSAIVLAVGYLLLAIESAGDDADFDELGSDASRDEADPRGS